VKEEVGNSMTDGARSIAGGVFTVVRVNPTIHSLLPFLAQPLYVVPHSLFAVLHSSKALSNSRAVQQP
jgi:hypothetical protein